MPLHTSRADYRRHELVVPDGRRTELRALKNARLARRVGVQLLPERMGNDVVDDHVVGPFADHHWPK